MIKFKNTSSVLLLTALLLGPSAAAQDPALAFSSGPGQVSLIELYTSEGCSSCPPADRWLSALGDGNALWQQVVPVAFHVSYWDRLGWPDRFAQRQFDRRQRAVAARVDSGIYTPGVFKDGLEFRRWRHTPPTAIGSANAANSAATRPGNLSIQQLGEDRWRVSFDPSPGVALQPARIYAAVLGSQLSNAIRRGENAGKRLDHDFVVLQLESAAPDTTSPQSLQATFRLDTGVTDHPALAAWVTSADGAPLQAVGGAL